MSQEVQAKARQRTYTTIGTLYPPNFRQGLSSSGPGATSSSPSKSGGGLMAARPAKKSGIHPIPQPPGFRNKICNCDPNYLKSNFCLPNHPSMNFHERFFSCSVCAKRPADRLCCRTWRGFCEKHALDYVAANPRNHVFCNYEIWQYEECFWCYKCDGYCVCDSFDAVLEPLFVSKGSFVNEPVTEKHSDYFEDHGLKVGTGTMQGWRADNEDSHVVFLNLPISGMDYFAVFDGHGGPLVARIAGKMTHELFDGLTKDGTDPSVALPRAFIKFDEYLAKETTPDESGATGCTANVVVLNHAAKKIFCANAGDARAVLCRNGKAIPLSSDHRPSNPSERARITASGSMVSEDDRVEGLLAVSRAFGDFDFKQASSLPPQKQAVTSMPDVTVNHLTQDDQFIILACDGIWDCMTSQEVVTFVLQEMRTTKDPQQIVENLLDRCVAREIPEDGIGTDNMSAVLVLLK